jgi:hypothetical protein
MNLKAAPFELEVELRLKLTEHLETDVTEGANEI